MTFQFGAPSFIKNLEFDRKALVEARLDAAPELCATQDFSNDTSVEMPALEYEQEPDADRTTTLREVPLE